MSHLQSDEWFEYFLARENSVVTDYFSGQFMNSIVCDECGNRSISFDNFMDLSLSFSKHKSASRYSANSSDFNVEELLQNFFSAESLDDKFICKRCRKA